MEPACELCGNPESECSCTELERAVRDHARTARECEMLRGANFAWQAERDRLAAALAALKATFPEDAAVLLREVGELLVFAHNAMGAPNIIDGPGEAERIRQMALQLRAWAERLEALEK
jgi:hypothetical protein